MKINVGASAIFYLIIGVTLVVLLLAAPFPHLTVQTDSWFLGQSVGNRLLGNADSTGVPLDKVVVTVTRASVTSPLDIKCEVDSDCTEYIVANQCNVYCGNSSPENQNSVTQLNRQRVCDPSSWRAEELNCTCVAGRCVSLE